MNEHGVDDVMRFPVIKMWNLPITHNKSSTRWKDVRAAFEAPHMCPPCTCLSPHHMVRAMLVAHFPGQLACAGFPGANGTDRLPDAPCSLSPGQHYCVGSFGEREADGAAVYSWTFRC